MRFRNLRTLLTCEVSAVLLLGALHSAAHGASCAVTNSILSNQMYLGAGGGDTLWIASSGSQGWGLNDTIDGHGWQGYTLGCYADRQIDNIAYGNGVLVAILNSSQEGQKAHTQLWHFPGDNPKGSAFFLKFTNPQGNQVPDFDTNRAITAINAVFAGGKCWFSCGKGGVAQWDPQADPRGGALRAWIPGDTTSFGIDNVGAASRPQFDSTKKVLWIDRCGADSLLVATKSRVWIYDLARNAWDSSLATAFAAPGMQFDSITACFANNDVKPPLIYSFMHFHSGADTAVSLMRYHAGIGKWSVLLSKAPNAVTPGARGALYTIYSPKTVKIYRDALPDSVIVDAATFSPLQDFLDFDKRLNLATILIPKPDINDIVYVPKSDSSGRLALITSSGLFTLSNEVPGDTTKFSFVQRALPIAGGLSQTYALPGILNDYAKDRQATFIYKLNNDARVTIRIYDYSMQLTKVVINNEFRRASGTSGRSTDATRDVWDGRTDAGRMAAPGVYYYKITASTGEHSFGKIILAKMPGN